MQRIVHDVDPFLIRFYGDIGIRWYSLAYVLTFLLVRWYLMRAARAGELDNMDEAAVDSWVGWSFLGALVGARFFHVFVFEFSHYYNRPEAWLAVWRGGLSFHGGLTGVAVVTWLFCRRHGARFYQIADRTVIPIAIGLGFGRIANFINAEMYGTPYDGPFCVDYSQNQYMYAPPEGCRHPVQLYESAKNFGLAVVLLGMRERLRPRPGVLTWTFIGAYGIIRFFLMYVREERIYAAGLTLSQIFSGAMAILAAVMLVVVLRTEPPRGADPSETAAARSS
jgi:phosphatidylglycerol---prolipoprotein diacylglyceryl transferase